MFEGVASSSRSLVRSVTDDLDDLCKKTDEERVSKNAASPLPPKKGYVAREVKKARKAKKHIETETVKNTKKQCVETSKAAATDSLKMTKKCITSRAYHYRLKAEIQQGVPEEVAKQRAREAYAAAANEFEKNKQK